MDLNFKSHDFVKPSDVETTTHKRLQTGLGAFDSLIGGIVPGQVIILSSPPGVGKTTFCLQLAEAVSLMNSTEVAFISGEQTIEDLASTCKRINTSRVNISTNIIVESFLEKASKFSLIVIDSIQTLHTNDDVKKSKKSQHITNKLIKYAKETGTALILISQATKSGRGAGSNEIYHAGDAIMEIYKGSDEFFDKPNVRVISLTKNRHGNVGDIALNFGKFGFDFFSWSTIKIGSFFGKKAKSE